MTAPVVGEIVSVPSEFETDCTGAPDEVMNPESLVSCEVASLFHCITVPLVVMTVEEAPTVVRPVPPLAMGSAVPL